MAGQIIAKGRFSRDGRGSQDIGIQGAAGAKGLLQKFQIFSGFLRANGDLDIGDGYRGFLIIRKKGNTGFPARLFAGIQASPVNDQIAFLPVLRAEHCLQSALRRLPHMIRERAVILIPKNSADLFPAEALNVIIQMIRRIRGAKLPDSGLQIVIQPRIGQNPENFRICLQLLHQICGFSLFGFQHPAAVFLRRTVSPAAVRQKAEDLTVVFHPGHPADVIV